MTTPQPPKRKSKINFPDPDFHQQKKDFNKQIREVIFGFSKIIPRSRNRDLLLKFLDCIIPGKSADISRLPYVGKEANAKSENKITCIFAEISGLIQMYWAFCNNQESVFDIELYLQRLNQILSNGLNQYQIRGDLASGFYLEKK